MPLPSVLGSSNVCLWNVPKEISDRTDINRVHIWRSTTGENAGYSFLDSVGCTAGTGIVTSYTDTSLVGNSAYYLVTFAVDGFTGSTGATGPSYESSYNTTYYYPLPRELRIIEAVKRSMPDVMSRSGMGITDADYMVGLRLAVQIFNTYPPETYFALEDFPASHEYFLVGLAQLTTIASRFLSISIRDWSYSEPGGVVMQVDRGAKITQALQIIGNVYTQYLPLVKLDFGSDNCTGVGTIALPLSMGGVISRGASNLLDMFTSIAR